MDGESQGCQLGNHPSPSVSASHDKASAVLPVQQPSAPSRTPPDWSVQLGTLVGHWGGCASLGCGSRSQGLKGTVWGHGWYLRKLKAVHCWYFWILVPCDINTLAIDVVWSVGAAEGCVQPFREDAGLAAVVVTFHLCLLICGLRWLEGQVRMFRERVSVKCCGERGQSKPCGASSAEERAKRC